MNYGPFYVFPKQSFRERVDTGALIPAGAPATTPDTEQPTLNVNLRAELGVPAGLDPVPGLHARTDTVADGAARGNGQLPVAPIWRGRASDDVIMLKLAYWLG